MWRSWGKTEYAAMVVSFHCNGSSAYIWDGRIVTVEIHSCTFIRGRKGKDKGVGTRAGGDGGLTHGSFGVYFLEHELSSGKR